MRDWQGNKEWKKHSSNINTDRKNWQKLSNEITANRETYDKVLTILKISKQKIGNVKLW